MTVRVDLSEVLAIVERAREELRGARSEMRRILASAAANERAQHGYQNRTHMLERTTRGRIDRVSADGVVGELIMEQEYASYVVRRGLSEIDAQARVAEDNLTRAIDEMGRRVA